MLNCPTTIERLTGVRVGARIAIGSRTSKPNSMQMLNPAMPHFISQS